MPTTLESYTQIVHSDDLREHDVSEERSQAGNAPIDCAGNAPIDCGPVNHTLPIRLAPNAEFGQSRQKAEGPFLATPKSSTLVAGRQAGPTSIKIRGFGLEASIASCVAPRRSILRMHRLMGIPVALLASLTAVR